MSAETMAQIQPLLLNLSRQEKLQLVSLLAEQLRQQAPIQPIDLEGRWQGAFPPDFDLDQALQEIRGEWLKELEWIAQVERGEEDADAGLCP